MTRKIYLILIVIIKTFIYANEFEDEFDSFLKNESEIATKFKLNIDYAPSIVSILKGETLEKLGAKNLFEALAFIPGVDTNRVRHGEESLNIRGIFNGYYGGKYKFLINEIPINQQLSNDIFPYLPIEQIKQIEVIRGPGSSLYGESAFNGVINIVTKKNENKFSFGEEFFSENRRGKLSSVSLFFQENKLKVNILASQNQNDGDKIISNGMLIENLENHHYSLINLNYENTDFTFISASSRYGDFYGLGHGMVPYDGKENGTNKTTIVSLKQKIEFSDNLYLNLTAYNSIIKNIGKDIVIYPNKYEDLKMDLYYKEKQYALSLDLHYKLKNHTILAGYYSKDTKQGKTYKKLNYDPLTFMPSITTSNSELKDGNLQRVNRAIYIQDIYKLNNKFSLTFGVRNDSYSDIKSSTTPKIAGVYEINRENIFKAQFAKSFRTPSFNEKYNISLPIPFTNKCINKELIDTYEIAYILNKFDYSFKTNLFYSKLSDLIFFDFNTNFYSNIANANSKGIEIEFNKNYKESLMLNSNVSYVQTKYENIDIDKIDNLMLNLALLINPYSNHSLSLWYRYINEKVQEKVKKHSSRNYHIIDMNFEKTCILGENIIITKIGIKNLFDTKYRYFDMENLNLLANGRSLWFGLSYEF